MSDNIENVPTEEPSDDDQGFTPLQFIIGSQDKDHSDCHADSPCQNTDQYRAINKSLGIRGIDADGEVWLSRADVLLLLAETFEAYQALCQEFAEKEGEENKHTAFSAFISANTVNMIGAQLHRMTERDRAIDLDVPDTVPTDWLSDNPTGPAAPESPIETAIRKAKEAALEAQKAKEEGK